MGIRQVDETTQVRRPVMGMDRALSAVRADAYYAAKQEAERVLPLILQTGVGKLESCDYDGRPFDYTAATITDEVAENELLEIKVGMVAATLYTPSRTAAITKEILNANIKALIEGHAEHMADQAVRVYQAECGL